MNFTLRTIKGDEEFNVDYPEDYNKTLEIYREYYLRNGYQEPWVAYFIFCNEIPMGTCAFVSAPINNKVEIAYWTYSEFEGRGVASFACASLIDAARQHTPSIIVTAKTEPKKNHSTRILERNGFILIGTVTDEEIGEAWLWENPSSFTPNLSVNYKSDL